MRRRIKRPIQPRSTREIKRMALPLSVPLRIRKAIDEGHSRSKLPIQQSIPIWSQGFYIHGPAGVGKSHQAALLMAEVLTCRRQMPAEVANPSIQWINVPRMFFELKATLPGNSNREGRQTEEQIVLNYSSCFWLALDDLGAEKLSDWAMQILYLIIGSRYDNELTTVITSNISLEDMAHSMADDRLSSRIGGMCTEVEFTGKDWRVE